MTKNNQYQDLKQQTTIGETNIIVRMAHKIFRAFYTMQLHSLINKIWYHIDLQPKSQFFSFICNNNIKDTQVI